MDMCELVTSVTFDVDDVVSEAGRRQSLKLSNEDESRIRSLLDHISLSLHGLLRKPELPGTILDIGSEECVRMFGREAFEKEESIWRLF